MDLSRHVISLHTGATSRTNNGINSSTSSAEKRPLSVDGIDNERSAKRACSQLPDNLTTLNARFLTACDDLPQIPRTKYSSDDQAALADPPDSIYLNDTVGSASSQHLSDQTICNTFQPSDLSGANNWDIGDGCTMRYRIESRVENHSVDANYWDPTSLTNDQPVPQNEFDNLALGEGNQLPNVVDALSIVGDCPVSQQSYHSFPNTMNSVPLDLCAGVENDSYLGLDAQPHNSLIGGLHLQSTWSSETGLHLSQNTSASGSDVLVEEADKSFTTPRDSTQTPFSGSTLNDERQVYDTCFGVIVATPQSSPGTVQDNNGAQILLKPFGNFLRISLHDSDKYGGILNLPVLCRLLKEFNCYLTATFSSTVSKTKRESSRPKIRPAMEYSTRIVVYGLRTDQHVIGDLLSKADIYLQHPFAEECDKEVEYANPHYLLRPGSHMPDLERQFLTLDNSKTAKAEKLDEVRVARLQRIFDCAAGKGIALPTSLQPSPRLRSALMEHQLIALHMMAEREIGDVGHQRFPSFWVQSQESSQNYRHVILGTLEDSPSPIRGGVLADEMGLGKTLSMLALICSSLDGLDSQTTKSHDVRQRGTLIVSPKSTINEWKSQIARHIITDRLTYEVYHGPNRRHVAAKLGELDIVLTTYETLRSEWENKGRLFQSKWVRVILDEAHHIRNRSSQVFHATSNLQAQYRWCLTGTPIHNSLDDYGALLAFIGVQPFHEKAFFNNWIVSPIMENNPAGMRRLRHLIQATCLRRTKNSLNVTLNLPKLIERTRSITLFPEDQELYKFFEKRLSDLAASKARRIDRPIQSGSPNEESMIVLLNFLRLICNHGEALLPASALSIYHTTDRALIDWRCLQSAIKRCNVCGEDFEKTEMRLSRLKLDKSARQSLICSECSFLEDSDTEFRSIASLEKPAEISPYRPGQSSCGVTRPSAKLNALLENLREEQRTCGDGEPIKSVVFSHWTKMLNLIEGQLRKHDFIYQRIDGQTLLPARSQALRFFNEDPKCTIMLASIGSCGEGIDFTAANRLHLLEPHWNPMIEAQAIDRIHRIGQRGIVTVIRYIVLDSVEIYIQQIQRQKIDLINSSMNNLEVGELPKVDFQEWKGNLS